MNQKIQALVVYTDDQPSRSLDWALQNLRVETCPVHTCEQARDLLEEAGKLPDIVFTDATLLDGSWKELLMMGRETQAKTVVVGRMLDYQLYLDVMESGAFDFLLPPFVPDDLAHVLVCATEERFVH